MLLLYSNTVGRLTPLVVTVGGVRGIPPDEPRQGAVLVHRRLWDQHRFLHPHNWCHAASTFTWLSQVHSHDLDGRCELPSSNLRFVTRKMDQPHAHGIYVDAHVKSSQPRFALGPIRARDDEVPHVVDPAHWREHVEPHGCT